MKKIVYNYPKSSFLSVEKDASIIVDMMMRNDRLKKLLHYTTKDCLDKPNLTEDETLALFGKHIKVMPEITIDKEVLSYINISFDNFVPNGTNPEFRDNDVEFSILCHADTYVLKDFALRPYKIAAEIDTMFNGRRLTGIGKLEYVDGVQIMAGNEYYGLSLRYHAVHGEEDKKDMPNPLDQEAYVKHYDALFNN